VENLVALAVGASEEVGVVGAAFVSAYDGGYMNGPVSGWHVVILAFDNVLSIAYFVFYWLHLEGENDAKLLPFKQIRRNAAGTSV